MPRFVRQALCVVLAVFGLVLSGSPAVAHPGHDHEDQTGPAVSTPTGRTVEVEPPAAAPDGPAPAPAVPAGFRDERVAGGSDLPAQFQLNVPTGMAMLPDGRILVTEKAGKLRVIKNGVVQALPVFDLTAQIYSDGDGGLIGVTSDPQFATNGFIYVTYKSDNPREGRVSRFTMLGDSAALASEVILLRTTADDDSHQIDSVKIGADGLLYASAGDSAPFAKATLGSTRSQQADQSVGKVFRMTRDGKGVSSNPFWTGNADAVASKVFALGLRNPFRFTVRPNGTVIVGDVGWNSAEEVNKIVPGVGNHNYGWPCYEGDATQPDFSSFATCQTLVPKGFGAVTAPSFAYGHAEGSSITGGPVYDGTAFPTTYRNAYFFGDYSHNWIDYWPMDVSGDFVGQPIRFADANSPVDIQVGADGALYYVSINKGQVRRIAYGTVTSCAPGNYFAQYYANMTWTGSPSLTRCDDTIDYDWGLGSPFPSGSPVDQFSVSWTGQQYFAKGASTISATSDDGTQVWVDGVLVIDNNGDHAAITKSATVNYAAGGFHTVMVRYYDNGAYAVAKLSITSANKLPTPVISTPTDGTQFTTGQTFSATGSGTDPEDGALAGASLRWSVILNHCPPPSGSVDVCHTHPIASFAGTSGTITGVDTSTDWVWMEVQLTAIDSAGASNTTSVRLFPKLCSPGAARALYYANQTWSGAPTITRCDAAINNDWGAGGPFAAGGPVNNYSIEWHVPTYLAAGASVNVVSDDGAQVFIDGQPLVDNNGIHPASLKSALTPFAKAGWHDVYVRYYEATGDAVAQLNTSSSCAAGTFAASYYTNATWSGTPSLKRCDGSVNFNWGLGGPIGGVADNYSAEWYATRYFPAGTSTVTVGSDDGGQLWVDDALVVDNSGIHGFVNKSANLTYASAGWHRVRIRYYEAGGYAQVAYAQTP